MDIDPLVRDLLVRGSAWLSFVCYLFTLINWIQRHSFSSLRLFWTMGWFCFLAHVALAFHLVHHWSHEQAWEATRKQGGVGEGIYFNYLVLAVWSFDVLWWWLWPGRYLQRRSWITLTIQGFLLFMWFNAAVVFARGYAGIAGALCFLLLAVLYLQKPKR